MLAIIGGTGIYNLPDIEVQEQLDIKSPFGIPSASLVKGRLGEREVIFLPRHGVNHSLLPSEVNYRANIYALKAAGATQVLAISAVGSLKADLHPGEFGLVSQYFDWTKGKRSSSFFGDGVVAHISSAEPTCPRISRAVEQAAGELGLSLWTNLTYACVEGPRLGTRAESHFLRGAAGCDLVGMTGVPEAFLAREAQMCYATLAVITDYDCWLDDPEEHVTVSQVITRYQESLGLLKRLLFHLLQINWPGVDCTCRTSLKDALLTPWEQLSPSKREWLDILMK